MVQNKNCKIRFIYFFSLNNMLNINSPLTTDNYKDAILILLLLIPNTFFSGVYELLIIRSFYLFVLLFFQCMVRTQIEQS